MNTLTADAIRNQFLLDPTVIYLNHGSFGATPQPVFESAVRWQREMERQPTEFLGRRAPDLLESSRQVLGEYLGAGSASLAYVTNATTGLNVAARSLRLGPGDEVLATDHEYGALDRTWRFLARKQGFQYINQPIPVPLTSADDFVHALWQGVTPATRVIFLSHITSPTALIFPVEAVCERARAEGIITIVDGAHVPGHLDLHLANLGADFYSGNLHKWLCAPKGAAFLYARAPMLPQVEPLIVSWGYESANPGPSTLVDYVEWQGTRDLSAFLAVPDAIAFQRENNWETVRERCHRLAVETVQRITAQSGTVPLAPLTREWIAQMASTPLPAGTSVEKLHAWLYQEHRIEIPVLAWNDMPLIRCSFQAYNSPEDADRLVEALGKWKEISAI